MAKKSNMVVRSNHYYKYICIWNNDTKTKKQIPIKLAHIDEYEVALYRKGVVERRAEQFKRDNQLHLIEGYKFTWESESGKEELKPLMTLKMGMDLYFDKMGKLRRNNTLKSYTNSFNHWLNFFDKKNTPIRDIKTKHLSDFVVAHKGNRSDTSINMDLRNIRTLLYYLRDVQEVDLNPKLNFKYALKECPINDTEPIYITEVEFNKIMERDWCLLYTSKREWYREVFKLYWDLGIRLSEGFQGVIIGNYLHIPEEVAKNKTKRDIRVTSAQIKTIEKMQQIWRDKGMTKDHIRGYSKVFKKALRHCKIDDSKHFHSLRHSYAIRRRLETNGNGLLIKDEMGHKSLETTQKYLKCKLPKLKDDFPSFKKVIKAMQNGQVIPTSTMKTSTMEGLNSVTDRRQIN